MNMPRPATHLPPTVARPVWPTASAWLRVIEQFGQTVGAFRAFGRLRRNRNRFEYPGDSASEPTTDDVDDAISVAAEAVTRARVIIEQNVLDAWTG
jgi:hypothetical protein